MTTGNPENSRHDPAKCREWAVDPLLEIGVLPLLFPPEHEVDVARYTALALVTSEQFRGIDEYLRIVGDIT